MDVRLWSKELITDFINLYRSFPCLWKNKSDCYKNKNLRNSAFKTMINFCRARGFPEANKDFVAKKIQSLRGSFRKEFKKVQDSEKSGRGADEIYVPTLWYFDLMLFTKDQEVPTSSNSNMDSADFGQEDDVEVEENNETDTCETEMIQEEPETPHPKAITKKRKVLDPQADFVKLCTSALQANIRSISDFEGVGINLANKLLKMEPSQAIYAEYLVSDIIKRGLLNKLTENTDICDNGCNRIGPTWASLPPASTSQSSWNETPQPADSPDHAREELN